jgi:transcription antitermination factor NusG
VFSRFDASEGLLPILTIPGVIRILSAGRCPISVPDHEIEAIQTVVRSGLPAIPWPNLEVGSPVLVEHGTLAGLQGVVLKVDTKFRIVISVPLLQRSVAVEIERDWVRPLPANERRPDRPLDSSFVNFRDRN